MAQYKATRKGSVLAICRECGLAMVVWDGQKQADGLIRCLNCGTVAPRLFWKGGKRCKECGKQEGYYSEDAERYFCCNKNCGQLHRFYNSEY